MNCIIVDDDQMTRTGLEYLCDRHPSIELVGSYESIAKASIALKEHMPDLVLLDVEMPGGTGFDLLDQLPIRPNVIIVSSKEEYAFSAFEYEAVDYLKKPVARKRFDQAIEKITQSDQQHTSLFIRSDGRLIQLKYNEIDFIEKIGDYVQFNTASGKVMVHSTIKNITGKLPSPDFIKVHRSFIINIHKIVDIEDHSLVIGDKIIPISRAQRPMLLARLNML